MAWGLQDAWSEAEMQVIKLRKENNKLKRQLKNLRQHRKRLNRAMCLLFNVKEPSK